MTAQKLPCEYQMEGGDAIHVAPITLLYGDDDYGLGMALREVAHMEGDQAELVPSNRVASSSGLYALQGENAGEVQRLVVEILPSVDITYPNVGGGARQLTWLFVRTLDDFLWLICIEEPTIHLHPVAVRRLARALHGIVARERLGFHTGRPNKRLLMSTMNEQFIVAFLALVAEGKLAPDDLAIYHMGYGEKRGSIRYERQAVNAYGQVKGGLASFAEGEMEDMRALFGLSAEAKAADSARIRRTKGATD